MAPSEIETGRLLLRPFCEQDLNAFFELFNDEEVNTFLPWFPLKTHGEAQVFLREKYLPPYRVSGEMHYAICLLTNRLPIGYISVSGGASHDLGYGLRKEFWGQGIVTEACGALIQRLKRAGPPFLTATHDIHNPGSGKVMKKLGMTYCYSYEEFWQPKNQLVTFRMYQMDLNGQSNPVYREYWDTHPVRFVEENVE